MITNDDIHSGLFQCSESKTESSVDGTSNPKSLETYSVFGDACCGEPLFAQHVSIDFTPNDDTDNDFVQKKVCSFWQFINGAREIQNLKVKPEKNIFTEASTTTNITEMVKSEPEPSKVADGIIDRTAVDMLGFAEEKNLIDRIFEAKMPLSNCTLGSREYKEGEVSVRPKKRDKKKQVCTCSTVCASCPVHAAQRCKQASGLSPIRILSRKLNEWDAKHPKLSSTLETRVKPREKAVNEHFEQLLRSMEPPGHAPPLQHCVIQRQASLLPNATYMFTVSCYAFHPLIQRFVRLWRYVQVVSDVLTFILSMICCQCMDAMPLSTSSSVGTKPSVQIFESQAMKQRTDLVDPGRSSGEPMRAQHLVIDFTPGREDTPEIQARCHQFWEFAKNRPELEGMMVHPSPKPERHLIDLSSGPAHADTATDRNNLPAIHMMKKMNKKGVVKAALESGEVNKYFT